MPTDVTFDREQIHERRTQERVGSLMSLILILQIMYPISCIIVIYTAWMNHTMNILLTTNNRYFVLSGKKLYIHLCIHTYIYIIHFIIYSATSLKHNHIYQTDNVLLSYKYMTCRCPINLLNIYIHIHTHYIKSQNLDKAFST